MRERAALEVATVVEDLGIFLVRLNQTISYDPKLRAIESCLQRLRGRTACLVLHTLEVDHDMAI